MKLSKKEKQKVELISLFVIALSSIFLWNTIIIFPIKLLVVLLHEISHGIAAIISGGKILAMDIGFNLGGKCETQDGNAFIIASSGYLGSFVFGSAIFYSAYDKTFGSGIIVFIGIILILFSINVIGNSTIGFIAILFSILLFIIIRFSPKVFSGYVLKSIGLISCLYALIDIKEDVFQSSGSISDASIVANLTGISEIIWGMIWLSISVIGIYLLLRFGYKKGLG